jgi:hypothetical protein
LVRGENLLLKVPLFKGDLGGSSSIVSRVVEFGRGVFQLSLK